MRQSYKWIKYLLLSGILLQTSAAWANPVIFSDADLFLARWGLLPILIAETLLASWLLELSGYSFRRMTLPVFLLNLGSFTLFSRFLIFGRYEIGYSVDTLLAEIAIICLEAFAFYYLTRTASVSSAGKSVQFSLGKAVALSTLCNFVSFGAGVLWHIFLEMSYTV